MELHGRKLTIGNAFRKQPPTVRSIGKKLNGVPFLNIYFGNIRESLFLSAAPPMYSPVIPVDPAYFYAANQWLQAQKAPLSVGSTFVLFSNFRIYGT